MSKVIEATGDGACLFNALAIGLGVEIISGRLDVKKDTPGYQRFLHDFARHHPQFRPQTWDNLKKWLSYYNNSRDWELILAPVLFKLNQQYQEKLEHDVLNELTNFIRDNKESIVGQVAPHYMDYSKCSKIDNLNLKDKQTLIKELIPLIRDWDQTQDFSTIKSLVSQKAGFYLDLLKQLIMADPNAFQRGYSCPELKGMTDALSLQLIENGLEHPSDELIQIRLQNKEQHWNVLCNESDYERVIQFGSQKLGMTSLEAFQGVKPVDAPSELQLTLDDQENVEDVQLHSEEVDNPGAGDCAFYAFAIGLINIIQEENSYKSKLMFDRLVAYDESLRDQFDAIINFNVDLPNNELLDQLQTTLRLVDYHYRLNELKEACANPKDDYAQLVANSNFINFAALYYNDPQDIDPHYNEFANSDIIQIVLADIDRSQVLENYEHLTLVPLFLTLMYGEEVVPTSITKDTLPSSTSPIIDCMSNITQQAYWGTHLDLDYLARAFEVNLHIYENAHPIQEFHDVPERHTITLRNQNNAHWVTEVTSAKKANTELANVSPKLKSEQLRHEAITDKGFNAVNPDQSPATVSPSPQSVVPSVPPVVTDTPSRPESSSSSGSEKAHHPVQSIKKRESSSALKPEESDENKLVRLKQCIANATIAYTEYSEKNCYFSFFHRHGSAGRARARQFNEEFANVGNYTDAKRMLVNYLKDSKNGNTYDHSYRTMLLNELQMDRPKASLQNTSKQFNTLLKTLITTLNVTPLSTTNRR
ncbi:hypothetical protein [Legionella bononiensis]|uniref:Dot/Icm T4SS effector n=1 Tax=Legionella bononiensis TaxID=2793102 RepID=A0ABS1WAB1_9GAMM|nr:hypothetical protein [Legionella bononiensis]MBL7480458.1 hypothetical protein [Legionella bononiensis]MBL7526307.1 hypothetical protein [Legionella bononiensis]MBL7563198.1 hypothetical protein [Legionella bononiensis]